MKRFIFWFAALLSLSSVCHADVIPKDDLVPSVTPVSYFSHLELVKEGGAARAQWEVSQQSCSSKNQCSPGADLSQAICPNGDSCKASMNGFYCTPDTCNQ